MAELTDFGQETLDYRFRDEEKFVETNSDWIGSIPSDWSIMKIDRCLKSMETGSREKYDGNDGVFSIGGEHLSDKGGLTTENENYISRDYYDSLSGGQIKTEDVLLIKDGATIGKAAIVDEVPNDCAAVNSHVYILRGKDFCSNRFLYYVVDSEVVQEQIQVQITGSAQEGLSTKFKKFVEVPIPPQKEQNAITEFLNRETSKIDRLIEKKTDLIDLIEEKRIAMVTDAVTQGLNSNIKTKRSGVPGLGEVPEDWDVVPLKHSSRNITVGIVQKPTQYYVDEGVPALRAVNVESNEIVKDDLVHISEECNEELGGSRLRAGDLISVRRGDPGTTAVVPEELDGANCISMVIIRKPDEYIPEFLCHLMNSEVSRSQVEAGTTGATMEHFNAGDVQELSFPKPDIEEQREILDWLSPRIREIDELREKINEGIELLKKYRTALITEAVTGQIDVRGEV
jgi:type I restriction enzyme S subunit